MMVSVEAERRIKGLSAALRAKSRLNVGFGGTLKRMKE